MEKVKNFFRKVGTFCKNTALKVGSFCKSTFLKVKGWALAHKIAAIAIAAGSVVAITLAIVLPVSISAANRKKSQQEPAEPEHVHVFANEWSKNSEVHWHAATCGHDVKGDEAAHTFGAWTVNGEKHEHSCSVCGYTVSADHEWGEWHISASSNKIDERECSVCGEVESRAHEHNYVVDKFVWQAMPRGYHVDAYYSCSLTDDIRVNAVVTPTEVERVDATDTADGHVKYHVEYTTPSGNKATEDKEFVLHRPDEHGFCLNCGEYAGETFSCEEAGSFSLYLGRPLAGDKLYFRCDLLSGHSLYLEDSDYALDTELTGYVKNGDLFSYAALDEEATINTGEDGYVYIVFEASFDRTDDDFLAFTRDHTETSFGLCLSDYVYSSKTYQVGQEYEINTTAAANKEYASFRFPIEKNHHYYLQLKDDETTDIGFSISELGHGAKGWLAVNHTLIEFPFVENSIIDEAYGYEPELIEIGDEIGDGYFYVRIRAHDSAEGMTLHLTVKEHFEVDDFEMCPGEIYVASLDEEIVLGEVAEGGHRIMSTDDTMYFRIKEGIAPNHTYSLDTNGFGPEIVNLYYWDRETSEFEPLDDSYRDGNDFTFPDTEMTSSQIYIEVAPIEALTDASITVIFEHHPGISCADSHGFCKYIPDEYLGHSLAYNTAFPSFTFGANSYRYFKVSKAGFEGKDRFVIKSEFDLLFNSTHVDVDAYYMRSDGSWWSLGNSSTTVGSHAVTYLELGKYYDYIDGDIYLVLHNEGEQVNNVDDLLVYGINS